MKKFTLAILFTLSSTVWAQSPSLKPGLWEAKQISMVVDGRDMNAQMAAAQVQMQQEMAKLSPSERKQMEEMMKKSQGMHPQNAVGGNTRICISPEMAAKDKPVFNHENGCEPTKISRSGNKTNFEINCTKNGRTTTGKGESISTNDTVTTRSDMTITDARGRSTMQMEMQMKYLGSDCQGVKPVDQLVKEAHDPTKLK